MLAPCFQQRHHVGPTLWGDSSVDKDSKGGQSRLKHMPAPKKFLVASTSLPLALGWGWNLSLYLGMLLGLLILLVLLLWMLLKQLRNSLAKSVLQPARSMRQPHSDRRLQRAL
ncbi:hypothetical protein FQA47_025584 [Oryzias melastigma]|uniref:Uncharacterized protein n=1 Tax=Oryzias melastigma TaxID=30732 RepID=A0A834CLG2_ORYME|nr:hypothetical protein FQA47_025584 [Oryzias melastigma]